MLEDHNQLEGRIGCHDLNNCSYRSAVIVDKYTALLLYGFVRIRRSQLWEPDKIRACIAFQTETFIKIVEAYNICFASGSSSK